MPVLGKGSLGGISFRGIGCGSVSLGNLVSLNLGAMKRDCLTGLQGDCAGIPCSAYNSQLGRFVEAVKQAALQ